MGNSTISLQQIFDRVAAKGIPTPLQQAAGYGPDLALAMGNDVLGDIISERFNWKWNRQAAAAIYTNSFQQDYPQPAQANGVIGWLEDADRVDINNTAMPKPIRQMTVRRQLSTCGLSWAPVGQICWMYNYQLNLGSWPGASVTYYPLVSTLTKQNPVISMKDANGYILIVTGFGTTGSVAPSASANAAEGTTVTDGTVTWTVVAANSQGFRVFPLPGASGPVYQITPYYQVEMTAFQNLQSLLSPIPDAFSRHFQKGLEAYCLKASPNPGDAKRGEDAERQWMAALVLARTQGDRENDAYAMLPATSPVENVYGYLRNPQDPSQPY